MSDDTKRPELPPGYYVAHNGEGRPQVVEFYISPSCDAHWRNVNDDRMKWDPRDLGYTLTSIPDLTRVTVVGEISDEMVERALYAYWQKDRHAQAFNFHDRGSMRAALTAALLPPATVKE
jgi:hypothetical protein